MSDRSTKTDLTARLAVAAQGHLGADELWELVKDCYTEIERLQARESELFGQCRLLLCKIDDLHAALLNHTCTCGSSDPDPDTHSDLCEYVEEIE